MNVNILRLKKKKAYVVAIAIAAEKIASSMQLLQY